MAHLCTKLNFPHSLSSASIEEHVPRDLPNKKCDIISHLLKRQTNKLFIEIEKKFVLETANRT